MHPLAIFLNRGAPATFCEKDPLLPAFVVFINSGIGLVLRHITNSKIAQPIIQTISVDMVDGEHTSTGFATTCTSESAISLIDEIAQPITRFASLSSCLFWITRPAILPVFLLLLRVCFPADTLFCGVLFSEALKASVGEIVLPALVLGINLGE